MSSDTVTPDIPVESETARQTRLGILCRKRDVESAIKNGRKQTQRTPTLTFSSHNWKPTSCWGVPELRLLHVDFLHVEPELFFGIPLFGATDVQMKPICDELSYSLQEYEMLTTEQRQTLSIATTEFYEALTSLVESSGKWDDEEAILEVSPAALSMRVKRTASKAKGSRKRRNKRVKICTDSPEEIAAESNPSRSDSFSSPPAQPPTRSSLKRRTALEHGPTTEHNPTLEAEQRAETTIRKLLQLILTTSHSDRLRLSEGRLTYHVYLGCTMGMEYTNHGSIILADGLDYRENLCALVNIDCQSFEPVEAVEAMTKIAARQFGGSLAIVQDRIMLSKLADYRHRAMAVLHTIAMHGLRAYLTKVLFPMEYRYGIWSQSLAKARVCLERTTHTYRLDIKEELQDFAAIVLTLLTELETQVKGGRRH